MDSFFYLLLPSVLQTGFLNSHNILYSHPVPTTGKILPFTVFWWHIPQSGEEFILCGARWLPSVTVGSCMFTQILIWVTNVNDIFGEGYLSCVENGASGQKNYFSSFTYLLRRIISLLTIDTRILVSYIIPVLTLIMVNIKIYSTCLFLYLYSLKKNISWWWRLYFDNVIAQRLAHYMIIRSDLILIFFR